MGEVSRPRLLIIGASGFLGQHIARRAASSFEVFGTGLAVRANEHSLQMDVTSPASVHAGFERVRPDAVVLLAAVSDIDECERKPELAHAVNVCGSANVAEACARTGARLVFTSSAAVFDGSRHGYSETDAPSPLSVYGTTKAMGEEAILRKLPSAIVVRVALAVGLADGAETNAMLNRLAARLSAGETVSFPDYEYRNPIDAGTLGCFMLELLNREDVAGTFHAGATDSISRFALGIKLAEGMGYPAHLIQPQTEPLPGRAPRGFDHFLLTTKLQDLCRTPVPNCSEVIERAIHGTS